MPVSKSGPIVGMYQFVIRDAASAQCQFGASRLLRNIDTEFWINLFIKRIICQLNIRDDIVFQLSAVYSDALQMYPLL